MRVRNLLVSISSLPLRSGTFSAGSPTLSAFRKLSSKSDGEMTSVFDEMRNEQSSDTRKRQTDIADREEELHQRLLSGALGRVPEYGWTLEAIRHGAHDCSLPLGLVDSLPYGGPADLAVHHVTECSQRILDAIQDKKLALKRHREVEKDQEHVEGAEQQIQTSLSTSPSNDQARHFDLSVVEELLVERLKMNLPLIDRLAEAKRVILVNSVDCLQLARQGLESELNMIGAICVHAGDESNDATWYTRRMTVYSVYKSAELVMVGSAASRDQSEKICSEMTDFVHRRLQQSSGDITDLFTDGGNISIKARLNSLTSVFSDAPVDLGSVFKGLAHTAKSISGISGR